MTGIFFNLFALRATILFGEGPWKLYLDYSRKLNPVPLPPLESKKSKYDVLGLSGCEWLLMVRMDVGDWWKISRKWHRHEVMKLTRVYIEADEKEFCGRLTTKIGVIRSVRRTSVTARSQDKAHLFTLFKHFLFGRGLGFPAGCVRLKIRGHFPTRLGIKSKYSYRRFLWD